MDHAFSRGEPLHVAAAKARRGTERIGMVDQALAHNGDGLEAAVRMRGEARHCAAVVHAPAVAAAEVLTDVASCGASTPDRENPSKRSKRPLACSCASSASSKCSAAVGAAMAPGWVANTVW